MRGLPPNPCGGNVGSHQPRKGKILFRDGGNVLSMV